MSRRVRRVEGGDVSQDERPGPAVDLKVVRGPEQLPGHLGDAEQASRVRGGRLRSRPRTWPCPQPLAHACFLLVAGDRPPVLLGPVELHAPDDDLERLGQALRNVGRAQDGVAVEDRFPGRPQGGGVQGTLQPEAPGFEAQPRAGRVHRVEQAAALATGGRQSSIA